MKETYNYPYPSHFGSHPEMISDLQSARLPDNFVLLEDEHGLFVTESTNLNNGMADPYRHSLHSRKKILNQLLPNVN